jgi:hypothetical protein
MLMVVGHLSGGAHRGRGPHLTELHNMSTTTKTLATAAATLMDPLLPLARILQESYPLVMSSPRPCDAGTSLGRFDLQVCTRGTDSSLKAMYKEKQKDYESRAAKACSKILSLVLLYF